MKPTETSFTADEICRIIKAAGDSKLLYFKYGKLEIRASAESKPETKEEYPWTSAIESDEDLKKPTQDTPPQGLKSKKEAIEEHLDDLLLDDPKAYEDAVMRGELDATTD